MNEVTIFNNPEFGDIRTLEIDNEPWFVGKDVATILGYSNPQKAIRDHVDDEDRTVNDSFTVNGTALSLINESGLYSLVLQSKLPTAKQFKRWVTSEVLPTIRKHGAYMTPDVLAQTIQNPDFLIGLVTELKAEQERRKTAELTVSVQNQQIAELRPKASYYDVVLNCKDLMSICKIAKDFGKSAVWLNKWLHEKGIQYKQGDIWLLYQKYAEKGYTSTKTQSYNGSDGTVHSKVHTYWTQKGRLFIYSLLKENGFLPLIEQDDDEEESA